MPPTAANVGESVVGPAAPADAGRPRPAVRRRPGQRRPTLFTFAPADGAAPIDLRAMVRGPDGVPVRDRSLDQGRLPGRPQDEEGDAGRASRARSRAAGRSPRRATWRSGGPDLLILDAKNVLWRWRPADTKGKGTLTRVNVKGSTSWGDDIMGINTFLRDAVPRPVQPVRGRSVRAADPGLLAGRRRQRLPGGADRLAGDRPRRLRDDLDLRRRRPVRGRRRRRWSGSCRARTTAGTPNAPDDTLLRPAPTYSIVAAATDRRGRRPLRLRPAERPDRGASTRSDGAYHGAVPAGRRRSPTGRTCARCTSSRASIEDAGHVVWLSRNGVHQALLEAVPDTAPASSPSASPRRVRRPSATPGGSASPAPSS